MNLNDFLLARIAEGEAAHAQAARAVLGWGGDPSKSAIIITDDSGKSLWTSDHILAECEAKRRLLKEHSDDYGNCATCYMGDDGACGDPDCCGSPSAVMKRWPCPTVRLLALPYTDHQDFRPEWKI